MSNLNPYSDDRIKRYGPISVDLFEDTTKDLGIIKSDSTKVFFLGAIVDNTNVLGTNTVDPQISIDTGTNDEDIVATATLTGSVVDRFWLLNAVAQPYTVTLDRLFRLRVRTNAVGQATTLVERTDGIATVTTAAVHGLSAGDLVWVKSMTDSSFDGKVTVLTVPTTTTFTYLNEGPDVASTADLNGRVGAHDVNVHLTVLYY